MKMEELNETTTTTMASSAAATDAPAPVPPPTNPLVTALLTDLYQITMTYAHWKNNRHNDPAVFELFFRKNPFQGEFTIFAGLDECLKFLQHFHFTKDDIEYLQNDVPSLKTCDPAFFDWLLNDCNTLKNVVVHAMRDGTVVFPRLPLMIIEAPLGVGQLLETTLLTLVNYPSLLATNAARMVRAARGSKRKSHLPVVTTTFDSLVLSMPTSTTTLTPPPTPPASGGLPLGLPPQCYKTPTCIEFGLRRAQGPDGGMSASKYAVLGGFSGTSNVRAGKEFGISINGTHAHAFVQAYSSLEEVQYLTVLNKNKEQDNNDVGGSSSDGELVNLLSKVLEYRQMLSEISNDTCWQTTNDGELAAFIAYAHAFPNTFLCLIDTYDTLHSGILNFIIVALVLHDLGYKPLGVRLDSGDLAFLSLECANLFQHFSTVLSSSSSSVDGAGSPSSTTGSSSSQHQYPPPRRRDFFKDLLIVASNDINEAILHSLNDEGHAITTFGIGTNLVTCQAQPALGCVYKLVELRGKPRMKLSQDMVKVLIPGKKKPYRLFGRDGSPLLDVMLLENQTAPLVGERILCRHPFVQHKRVVVTPSAVEPLHWLVFDNGQALPQNNRTLLEAKAAVEEQLDQLRPDILRYVNPTPYKISISTALYDYFVELWQNETPIAELK